MSELDDPLTYEQLRAQIAAIGPADGPADRTVLWAEPSHAVAVARDPLGRLEVFLVGDPLDAVDRIVANNLEHQVWRTASGAPLPANRLILPDAEHFDGVAAFICTELGRNGIADDPADAFRRTEPVIALALRRGELSNQAMVGLAGELFVIGRLVELLPHHSSRVVAGWFGSGPSSRDLQLGAIGVEIKTTTSSESVHHIQGTHQVELGVSVDHMPETNLFVLSVGLEWLPMSASSGRTIPDLVDLISIHLADGAERADFLSRVKQYGGESALGYDHETHRHVQRYRRPFQTRFERLYDMSDDRIRVLRSGDIAPATSVEPNSVSYRIRLPAKVRGDLNPLAGMAMIATRLDQLLDI